MSNTVTELGAFSVGASFIVVPDGVRRVDGGRYCRLSIAVAPDVASPAPHIDIRNWPLEIGGLVQNLRIAVGTIGGTVGRRTIIDARYLDGSYRADVQPGFESKATALWKNIFANPTNPTNPATPPNPVNPNAGFLRLIEALKAGAVGPQPSSEVGGPEFYGSYQTVDLSHATDTIYGAAAATALLQRLAVLAVQSQSGKDFDATTTLTGTPSDAKLLGVEWWRMMHEDWVGTRPLQDPASQLVYQTAQDAQTAMRQAAREARAEMALSSTLIRGKRISGGGARLLHPAIRPNEVFNALQNASTYFTDEIGNLQFWRNGHVGERRNEARAAAHAFRKEMVRFDDCWAIGKAASNARVVPDPDEELRDAAGRKYAAILSYPTLAKYLGLIVDIEVPASLLFPNDTNRNIYGAVAVDTVPSGQPDEPAPQHPELLDWTAYVFRLGSIAKGPDYFGPCDHEESVNQRVEPNQDLKDGILNLNSKIANTSTARFCLQTLDATNALRSLQKRAAEITEADLRGRPRTEQSTKIPDRQTRGITLFDRDRERTDIDAAEGERVTHKTVAQILGAPTFRISDAKSLTQGYRIDAAIATKKNVWRSSDRWRSLVARDVSYGERDIDPDFVKLPAVERVRYRDDGHIRRMTGDVDRVQGGDTIRQTIPHPDLFTWTGESLALPSPKDLSSGGDTPGSSDQRSICINPLMDLAVDITFNLPSQPTSDKVSDRRPPPLRDDRTYMFGARLMFVNGCSLTFEDAVTRYVASDETLALGRTSDEPYPYMRRHEIQAPDVLLPWTDRIVKAKKMSEIHGENIDYLVIRSGDLETDKAKRFVVPPRSVFDLSEQSGVFDSDSTSMRPPGAFLGSIKVRLDPLLGAFPVARKGRWEFPKMNKGVTPSKSPNADQEQSRGSVLVLDGSARRPQTDFYPDALARCMHARFTDEKGSTPFGFDFLKRPIEFWSQTDTPADAVPVLLELRRPYHNEQPSLRGWFDTEQHNEYVLPKNAIIPLRMHKLTIALKPAEVIELEIFSVSDPLRLINSHHTIAYALQLLASYCSSKKVSAASQLGLLGAVGLSFNQLLDKLTTDNKKSQAQILNQLNTQGAMQQLTTKRVVRLIHAVDRPVQPGFLHVNIGAFERIDLHPVVLTVTAGDDPQKARTTWDDYVKAQKNAQRNPLDWLSQEGGSITFFIGTVAVDRPSTVSLRCEARWSEYGADAAKPDRHGDGWVLDPPFNHAQLFRVDHIKNDDAFRTQNLNLLIDDDEISIRALSYSFPNGKARYLTLRLIATSRFTAFFPPETEAQKQKRELLGVGRYERATPAFEESEAKVWLPCTFRPPPLEVDRILPRFRWHERILNEGTEIQWTRNSSLRIFLKSTWNATGEGEMMGIIIWPPKFLNPSMINICELENQLGPYAAYVTRWGSDPIHLSGRIDDLVAADQFSDFQERVPEVLLTLAGRQGLADAPPPDPLAVSLLAYAPRLVQRRLDGQWYCDVTVDSRNSYFPFLRLGLVRYQSHAAVKNLQLSPPVTSWAQIPPRREGRVIFKDHKHLIAEVHGVGYLKSETGSQHADQQQLTDVPLLNVRLMRAVRADCTPERQEITNGWRPVLNDYGNPVEMLRIRPIQRELEVWWICEISLPSSRREVRYGLLIEEVELMPADHQISSSAPKECADNSFSTALEERGPLLLHVIDLGI